MKPFATKKKKKGDLEKWMFLYSPPVPIVSLALPAGLCISISAPPLCSVFSFLKICLFWCRVQERAFPEIILIYQQTTAKTLHQTRTQVKIASSISHHFLGKTEERARVWTSPDAGQALIISLRGWSDFWFLFSAWALAPEPALPTSCLRPE